MKETLILEHPIISLFYDDGPLVLAKYHPHVLSWLCKEHPQGTWRKQLMAQPPIGEIDLYHESGVAYNAQTPCVVAACNGVTLGDLDFFRHADEDERWLGMYGDMHWNCCDTADALRDLRFRMVEAIPSLHHCSCPADAE